MANKNQMQFKKLKRNHVGGLIILYILLFCLMTMLFAFSIAEVIASSFATKLVSEYESLYYLTKIYEKGAENENINELLSAGGREYQILDSQGRVLYKNGDSDFLRESATLVINSESVTTYEDARQNGLLRRDGKYWTVDFGVIVGDIWNTWKNWEDLVGTDKQAVFSGISAQKRELDESVGKDIFPIENRKPGELLNEEELEAMKQQIQDWNLKLTAYPMWFSLPMQDGERVMVGKVYFSINMEDAAVLLLIGISMVVLAVLAMILMIVSMIRGVLRQKKITNLYLTDPVTGGHNWMWFLLRGEPYLRLAHNAGKKYAVIEIVFINYRNFCVCHSVEEGEQILCRIYETITKTLGKKCMCAHAATSSFAVLEQYEEEEELRGKMRQLIQELENVDSTHKFAFHMGVNLLPLLRNKNGRPIRRKNLNLETEYNNACTARMTLEESEDSRIAYFDEKMVEEQKWLDAVTERQQAAVEREEFQVYYQPKYDPRTGKLCGAEALIRWNSPDLGFISPGKFIPLFEKNGFITEIDHYMISHVARDQRAWLDQGLSCVPVSVNVSRAHFIEKDLAEQICRMVDAAGTPHRLIEIELTESAFFDDKNAMITTIKKLKEAGFAVSMDDFGSGYSSLNSLKDMPLDVLKLDAEFFRGENAGERGEIVVSEAIKLARSLNMRTVAEGVEEKEQVEFLAEKGCDMIQGYYFAKPMPKGDYVERMKAGYAAAAEEPEAAVEEPEKGAVEVPEGETAEKPGEEAAGVPEGETAEKPGEEAAEVPEGETAEKPGEEAAGVPEGETAEKPGEEAAGVPEGETAEKPGEEAAGVPEEVAAEKPEE